jgi:hypothetical protein
MTATSWHVVYCNDEQIGRRVERWPSPRTTSESSLAALSELEEAQRRVATALVVFAERGSAAGLHRVRGVRDDFREAGHHAAALALALDEQARAVRVCGTWVSH